LYQREKSEEAIRESMDIAVEQHAELNDMFDVSHLTVANLVDYNRSKLGFEIVKIGREGKSTFY
jgi:hypothetical protein